MQDAKQFLSWVKWLRRHFPSAHPVRVALVPAETLQDGCGRCYGETAWDDDDRASVRIASSLSAQMTIETLHHEWAHVLRDHLLESPLDIPGGHDEVFYAHLGRIDAAWRKHGK